MKSKLWINGGLLLLFLFLLGALLYFSISFPELKFRVLSIVGAVAVGVALVACVLIKFSRTRKHANDAEGGTVPILGNSHATDGAVGYNDVSSTLRNLFGQPGIEKECQTDEFLQAILYKADVTLHKDTAHCKLKISDDGKEVQWIEEGVQNKSNGFNRFERKPFVLGTVVRSWRSYWEVCVEEKEDWVLGVALASANRKGQLAMGPSEGFWVIRLSNGKSLKALSEEVEVLTNISPPSTVGIYLDCKEKQVSFYSVDGESGSHIYTFKDGPGYDSNVCPIFSPWNNDDKKIRILSITP